MAVVEAHIVADRRGINYLDRELLAPGEMLDQLRQALFTDEIVDRERFFVHKAALSDGTLVVDEMIEEHREVYLRTMWQAARTAIQHAGARPVIFGLLGNRRRSMSALVSAFYSMLGRKEDLLLDVRLSDRRAEIGGDFFFPEQKEQVPYRDLLIDPKTIDIHPIDLALPRLGGLLDRRALESYEDAVRASQVAIDALTPPLLTVDLTKGFAEASNRRLSLSHAELVWYGFLANQRKGSDEGWAVAGQEGHDALRKFLEALAEQPWTERIRSKPLQQLWEGAYVPDEDLRNLRGKTVQKLKKWCAEQLPSAATWIIPESDGGRHQRLPLPAAHIVIL